MLNEEAMRRVPHRRVLGRSCWCRFACVATVFFAVAVVLFLCGSLLVLLIATTTKLSEDDLGEIGTPIPTELEDGVWVSRLEADRTEQVLVHTPCTEVTEAAFFALRRAKLDEPPSKVLARTGPRPIYSWRMSLCGAVPSAKSAVAASTAAPPASPIPFLAPPSSDIGRSVSEQPGVVVALDVWLKFYYTKDLANGNGAYALEYRCSEKRQDRRADREDDAGHSQLPPPLQLPAVPPIERVYRSFFRFVNESTDDTKQEREGRGDGPPEERGDLKEGDGEYNGEENGEADYSPTDSPTRPTLPSRWYKCYDEGALFRSYFPSMWHDGTWWKILLVLVFMSLVSTVMAMSMGDVLWYLDGKLRRCRCRLTKLTEKVALTVGLPPKPSD